MKNKKKSLSEITILAIIIASLGKGFGLLRELLMAAYYGASVYTDAYVMALTLPLIVMGFIQALPVAFTPIYFKCKTDKGEKIADKYYKQLALVIMGIATLLIVLSEMFMPRLISIIAPGYIGETRRITILFARIAIITGLTSALVELSLSFCRCNNKHLFASFVCLLVSPIECLFIYMGYFVDQRLIVLGPVVAHIIELVLVLFLIIRICRFRDGEKSKPILLKKEMKDSFTMVIPIFIGNMAWQLNTYVDKVFASGLPSGGVSSLNYAEKIYSMINTLVFVTICTILYPELAKHANKDNKLQFGIYVIKGINIMIILAVPIVLISIFCGNDIVCVLFKRGNFDDNLAIKTSQTFSCYMIGILGVAIHEYLAKVFYSIEKSKVDMIIGFIMVAINIFFDLILVNKYGQNGLAMATALSTTLPLPLEIILLKKNINTIVIKQLLVNMLKCLISGLLLAVSLLILHNCCHFSSVTNIFFATMITIGIYSLALYLFKVDEFILFWRMVIQKRKK